MNTFLFLKVNKKNFIVYFYLLFHFFFLFEAIAAEKKYELKVQKITKNITGVNVTHALAINGSIPAPTLKFKLGEIAVIKVINETDEPTTLHWHGLLVPWRQDGPQFSNTKIIEPNTSHTFRFPIRQTGTYWYHSHTNLQEQRGLYGPIVIEEEKPKEVVDHDLVFVMSDWTNEHPQQVLSNLKKDGDYYMSKKKSRPSILAAIRDGMFWNYLNSEWTRMGPMDLSDVGYDAFLINGHIESTFKNVKHGEKIRFRIINASASTYFYFNIGNLRNFKVISKDGLQVEPVTVNEILIGIAETYDIIFELPHSARTFEARATAQDITGSASLMFGTGEIEKVSDKIKPSPYEMDHMDHNMTDHDMNDHSGHDGNNMNDHSGRDGNNMNDHSGRDGNNMNDHSGHDRNNMNDHSGHDGNNMNDHSGRDGNNMNDHSGRDGNNMNDHSGHDRNNMNDHSGHDGNNMDDHSEHDGHGTAQINRLNYKMLKSVTPTDFDENLIRAQVIELELSGDMERYNWYINGKPFSEEKYIEITENEIITFKFINTTMMHHPMHLHGHFFRVLLGQGKFAPLFHTVDVAPMSTLTIEFHANEPGIWFLHCHNLYHMKMGMARLVKYKGIETTAELKKDEQKWMPQIIKDDNAFWRHEASFYSNTAKFEIGMNAGRYQLDIEIEVDEHDIRNLEVEALFKKHLSRFLSIGGGFVYEDEKLYAALTAVYNLPGNIEMQSYTRHDGTVVVKLTKILPITERINIALIPEVKYEDDNFDWSSSELELYYNHNETVSFGVIYSEESVGFGLKIGW